MVDEFQRLPNRYWDLLASRHPRGSLVLVASSLGVSRRAFDSRSPLLGLVAPLRVGVIGYGDVLLSLAPRLPPRDAALWALLLREPWLAPYPGAAGGTPHHSFLKW